MDIKEAMQYIGYGIKEGVYDPYDFIGWSDEKIIKFAQNEMDRADAYYDSLKENDI